VNDYDLEAYVKAVTGIQASAELIRDSMCNFIDVFSRLAAALSETSPDEFSPDTSQPYPF
jgi:hypothetical protein